MAAPEWRRAQSTLFATGAALVAAQRMSGTDPLSDATTAMHAALPYLVTARVVLSATGTLAGPTPRQKGIVSSILYGFLFVCIVAVLMYLLFLLFGAPPFKDSDKTWTLIAFFSILAGYPIGAYFKGNTILWSKTLYEPYSMENSSGKSIVFSALFTLVGSWAGAIALALDWQEPWLKYPTPIALGGTAGYFGGLAYVALRTLVATLMSN